MGQSFDNHGDKLHISALSSIKHLWSPLQGKCHIKAQCECVLGRVENRKSWKITKPQMDGSWYSFRPAWTHDFNAKISSEKEVPSHEILSKICQNLDILLKMPIFGIYSPISLDSLHLFFKIRLKRWNRDSKPVEKSTMNPINGRIFFWLLKGPCWPYISIFQWRFRHNTPLNHTDSLIFVSINGIHLKFSVFPTFFYFQPALIVRS